MSVVPRALLTITGVLLIALVAGGVTPAYAETFTVNSTGDSADSNTGDGICDDGAGNCTLRAAMDQANATPGADTIEFSIDSGVQTITPLSPLPIIGDPVTIDGTTQPGFLGTPIIELNGILAGAGVDGLRITAGSSTVRGLVINRFGGEGIELQLTGGNKVEGNYIGTDVTGTVIDPSPFVKGDELGNTDNGVRINGVPDNTVGGTAAGTGNVISGNGRGVSASNADGVEILGTSATGNLVQGNFIGTDVGGTLDLGNTGNGILIDDAPNNTVGGMTPGARNLISGNNGDGVEISGGGATSNLVVGNYIGTDVDGTVARRNSGSGVLIDGAPSNTVGGTAPEARNLISGNARGVWIKDAEATGNLVLGNYIGTDVNGAADLGNSSDGVFITGAPDNSVGGTIPGARNLISGNNSDGVEISGSGATGNLVQGNFIGTDVNGTVALGNGAGSRGQGVRIRNASGNAIGGTVVSARNIISGNRAGGVEISGSSATGNTVAGNYIGTDVSGANALGNATDVGGSGVLISSAADNVIGGASVEARNIISGSGNPFLSPGVMISGSTASGNLVQGNYIGTDVDGTTALGNFGDGLFIIGAPTNTIGGETAASGNIISGNGQRGVQIFGTAASGNRLQGNYIGTDVTGSISMGNGGDGIFLSGAPNNIIGGTTASAGNVISGNGAVGVEIFDTGATGNLVRGNFIGTDLGGTVNLGNTLYGVFINASPDNIIGGTAPGSRNIISGNDSGLFISGALATGNLVQGNYIGTDVSGAAALGNTFDGVRIGGAGSDNTIGGTDSGAGNTIAFNGGDGVLVDSGTGNAILGNAIFSNTDLGIDLGADGATANDAGDSDTGANNLQNVPELASAASGSTTIEGTLNSLASATFTLEFFSNVTCDPSGAGEGEAFIGSTTVTTDAAGSASINVTFQIAVPVGAFVTATATDPGANTSEFSSCIEVVVSTDADGDGVPDESDNCPAWPNSDQSLPPWPIPASDPDCDGFTTADESSIGTDPNLACGPNAWPPDFNDDGLISISDVLLMKASFGAKSPDDPIYDARRDLNPDGKISISDVLTMRAFFDQECTVVVGAVEPPAQPR